MALSRKSCRICLTETEFNVSLFGSYCKRTNMIEKILVCLKIVVEDTDPMNTICYKCAENIDRYYDFIKFVKKCQTKLGEPRAGVNPPLRHVTTYVREQVFDADYTFSFLDSPKEKTEPKSSSPFFSYFSPPLMKSEDHVWKTPKELDKRESAAKRHCKSEMPRHHSRDLFDSQSQDVEEEPRSLNWKLTPDKNILKRVRDKCFGRSDF